MAALLTFRAWPRVALIAMWRRAANLIALGVCVLLPAGAKAQSNCGYAPGYPGDLAPKPQVDPKPVDS